MGQASQCNGCLLVAQEAKLGERLLVLTDDRTHAGSVLLYELGGTPAPGQGKRVEHEGRPVRFIAWLMSPEHACGGPMPKVRCRTTGSFRSAQDVALEEAERLGYAADPTPVVCNGKGCEAVLETPDDIHAGLCDDCAWKDA